MTKDELVAELRKQGYMRIADLLEGEPEKAKEDPKPKGKGK